MPADLSGPVRTCVGCRRRGAARDLTRIRLGPRGLVSGPGPGRGAWVCSIRCLDEALHRGRLAAALRARAALVASPAVRAGLERPDT